eukprot:Gb_06830 [translate_table: standard]
MGSNFEEILDNVCYPEIFLSFLNGRQKRKKYLRSEENAILEFHKKLYCVGGDLVFSESLCKELQKKSLQQRCELGRIGRRNPNQKLNLDIPENEIFSLPQDVLAAADYSIRVKFGMGTLDDMDHLKNKRIRSVADLLQNQFGLALGRLGSKEEHMVYPSPREDEYYRIATGNSLELNQGIQEEQVTPARYRQEFLAIAREQIHFRSIFPFQYFSVGVSLIPFLEHNDANRALMGSNMQRQAIPLFQPEKCITGIGLEGQVALDLGSVTIAIQEGRIEYTNAENITFSFNGDTIGTTLVLYQRSNKNTCMHQKPQVRQGECVKKGQILADGAATIEGELSPGKNILVAYMPWEGYNFEDAILISKCLVSTVRESCLRVPIGGRGRVIDVRWIHEEENSGDNAETVHVYILQKRKIQVGDKVAGRHGNKGIISKVLPRQDMPYSQNGTPVDMVFNPLGVPSRMNVGQIFECLPGLAGNPMNKHYRITPFGERYEREASRKLVFPEPYRASEQTANPWVFEPDHPGKNRLIDGRTGDLFEQPVTIGKAYIPKLIHQVDDKIHARSSGPYALVTQQPLRGKSKRGGDAYSEI